MSPDKITENKKFFEVLFNKDDWVVYGSQTDCNSIQINDRMFEGHSYSHWNEKNQSWSSKPVTHFVVNPLIPDSRRKIKNIYRFSNMVFESDTVSLQDQKKIFCYAHKLGFKFSTLTFSGGKSIHCILSSEVPFSNLAEYKNCYSRIFLRLNEIAEEMSNLPKEDPFKIGIPEKGKSYFDSAVRDPSRYTRFPNVSRGSVVQKVYAILPRISKEDLDLFLESCPEIPPKYVREKGERDIIWDIASNSFDLYRKGELLSNMSGVLRSKFEYLLNNPGTTNRNRKLLSIYLGILDEFPLISKDYILELCEDTIYPALRGAGYPEERIYNNTLDWCIEHSKENNEEEELDF